MKIPHIFFIFPFFEIFRGDFSPLPPPMAPPLLYLLLFSLSMLRNSIIDSKRRSFCFAIAVYLSLVRCNFLSPALIVGHLVLFLLFLFVRGVQGFLSLVVPLFLFLFWFSAITVAFWHCSLRTTFCFVLFCFCLCVFYLFVGLFF